VKLFVFANPRLKKAVLKSKDLALKSSSTLAEADLAVILGGDGSLLRFVPELARLEKPVLFFPCGEQSGIPGFKKLTRKMISDFRQLPRKKAMLLEASAGKESLLALNDILIRPDRTARLFKYRYSVDGVSSEIIKGDGLLVSTPLGSYAYNDALGGPLLDRGMEAFVLNPVASFRSFGRALVVPSSSAVTVENIGNDFDKTIWADGQRTLRWEGGSLRLRKASRTIEFLLPE